MRTPALDRAIACLEQIRASENPKGARAARREALEAMLLFEQLNGRGHRVCCKLAELELAVGNLDLAHEALQLGRHPNLRVRRL